MSLLATATPLTVEHLHWLETDATTRPMAATEVIGMLTHPIRPGRVNMAPMKSIRILASGDRSLIRLP